jgi:beta-glucosidase-like glycosyl hydrolase
MIAIALLVLPLTVATTADKSPPSPPPPSPPPHPCAAGSPHASAVFCNASASAVERAKDLTAKLSVLEKATVISINSGFHGEWASEEFGLHVTGYTECSHASGSPHGSSASPHNGWRVTVFPAVMSTSGSFSRELVSAIANAISRETRAKHNNETGRSPKGPSGAWTGESSLYCFAPMINVCRDPRWGRCQEGNGEDPLLGHEFGRLYVEGYQNDEGTGVLKALATPKHFDVFSGPGNAPCPDSTHPNNECDVEIGLRDWMTTFQPAFRGAIIGGKARSVMCSYNSINGQPNCGNRHLLTDILRDEWGFDGHVVSDCGGVDHIWAMHHAVPDLSEATAMALRAGCDADCGHDYQQGVPLMIANGTIDMQLLDRAVTRVLTNRMLLGELEDDSDENPWRNLTLENLLPPHKTLARRAAREAIVLVKNGGASAAAAAAEAPTTRNGKQQQLLLPMTASSLTKVAVVGPSADSPSAYIGDYAPQPACKSSVCHSSNKKRSDPHAAATPVLAIPTMRFPLIGKNRSKIGLNSL